VELPPDPFDLIYADPPLGWRGWSAKGEGRSPQQKYRCPPLAELLAIPVADIAAKDSVLAIWVYGPRLPDTLLLIRAWGFTFKGSGFVWLKVDSKGNPRMGCGFGTRKETESLLLASRGKGLRRHDKGVREVIFAPRRAHSAKPAEAAERLDRLYGDVHRIELFGRGTARPGWSIWGDEAVVAGRALDQGGTPDIPDPSAERLGIILIRSSRRGIPNRASCPEAGWRGARCNGAAPSAASITPAEDRQPSNNQETSEPWHSFVDGKIAPQVPHR
jgi:N6-adenosine-specific RNA methylase IME4